jgi:Xaa-Pro dipeptidase
VPHPGAVSELAIEHNLLGPTVGREHAARLDALRVAMRARGLAAVAVVAPEGVYYLLGLDHLGYFAFTLLVVPLDGPPVLVTREMERPTVAAQVPGCTHLGFADGQDPADAVLEALAVATVPGQRVGLERQTMFFPPAVYERVCTQLPGRSFTDCTPLLAAQRAVKSAAELGHVRRAALISDVAMAAALRTAGSGVAEREVAAAACAAMVRAGGDQPGFLPLIRPVTLLDQEHLTWGDRTLSAGDGLFIELSGCARRYHAPLSRTVYVGRLPDGAREAHAAAVAGLVAARAALRPGARSGEVYAAWQHAVAGNSAPGWPSRHHCGYLVGIGFPPSWVGGGEVLGLRPGGDVEIRAGMVFHLMSWVTRPAGHVVSDTVVVTRTGAELLTDTPRELTVLS